MEREKNSATKTIGIVMVLTLLGKVMGLYRDRLLAVHYGMGMEANAFYTASRIPRVFFDAVFASAISACFIPVFSEYLSKKGKKEAFSFGCGFLTVMGVLTAGLTMAGIVGSEWLVQLFADGYDVETAQLATSLTQVMFPTVFFTGIAFSFVGILQSLDEFKVPALISAVSNAVIILYFLVLNQTFGVYGLAVAFLVGWLLQAVVQVPALHRLGFRYRPIWDITSDGMRKVFGLMAPVMISTWVQPINLTINSKFGSRLFGGAGVSAIEYATNLYLVIAGVFILSITNVIFPKLSRLTADGQGNQFRDTLRQTIHSSLFFVLPMSVGLMMVSEPLISFVYGGGEFDATSIQITSSALGLVSLGMAGYAVQNIVSRAYFAQQNGRVPLVAGGISIMVNIVLCMILTESMQVDGLAIASAVSSTVYAVLLLIPMQHSGTEILNQALCIDVLKMLCAAVGMAVVVRVVQNYIGGILPDGVWGDCLNLGISAGSGLVTYAACVMVLGLEEAKLSVSMIKQLLKRG